MGAEMEIPIMVKIITLIGCAIFFALTVVHDKVFAWLRTGAKHVAKLMLAGVNHIAKAIHHKEEQRKSKTLLG